MSVFDLAAPRDFSNSNSLSSFTRNFRGKIRILTVNYCHLKSWAHRSQKAPFWRLYWNRQKGAVIHLEEKRILLSPNKIYLIPPEVNYHSQLTKEFDHFYLHFRLLEWPLFPITQPMSIPFEKDLQELLEPSLRSFQDLDLSGTLALEAFIYKSLACLPSECWKKSQRSPRLEDLLNWMSSRLEHHDRNDELAKKVHLSPTAFSRWFKEEMGISPQRWLDEARMSRACDLLHQSSLSIDHVSAQLGYADRFHFSRTFKKVRGVPPGHFRKNILVA